MRVLHCTLHPGTVCGAVTVQYWSLGSRLNWKPECMLLHNRRSKTIGKTIVLLALGSLAAGAGAQSVEGKVAPKPLYRDPIHDGAADPTLIWNRAKGEWWMFYTNRRADLASADRRNVAWVHQTRIGIAVSRDQGATWTYRGTASIPYGAAEYTHWAPDIVYDAGRYHMFLSIVPGTFENWNAPREIVHLSSPDLETWKFESKLELGSDRVIDASLFHLPDGTWRLWY